MFDLDANGVKCDFNGINDDCDIVFSICVSSADAVGWVLIREFLPPIQQWITFDYMITSDIFFADNVNSITLLANWLAKAPTLTSQID